MGIVEQAGDVAKEGVRSLASTPALLSLVLLQAVILVLIAWVAVEQRKLTHEQMVHLINQCAPRNERGELMLPPSTATKIEKLPLPPIEN